MNSKATISKGQQDLREKLFTDIAFVIGELVLFTQLHDSVSTYKWQFKIDKLVDKYIQAQLLTLFREREQKLIAEFEEIIGEDEEDLCVYTCTCNQGYIDVNLAKAEQRQKLAKRKEGR